MLKYLLGAIKRRKLNKKSFIIDILNKSYCKHVQLVLLKLLGIVNIRIVFRPELILATAIDEKFVQRFSEVLLSVYEGHSTINKDAWSHI